MKYFMPYSPHCIFDVLLYTIISCFHCSVCLETTVMNFAALVLTYYGLDVISNIICNG